MTLTAITLPPAGGVTPEKLLIILHGWGADAQDLAPLGAALELPATQVILPNAPFKHFQVPGGRAWYALERPDYAGYPSAREQLQNWLIQLPQTTHIPWSQTVIAGFSQGGAMMIDVARKFPVAGLICMSGYLHDDLTTVDSPPPTLIVHGQFDPVVPLEQAQALKSTLQSWNTTVSYQEFAMGHEITPAAIATIRKFILKVCFS